MYEDETPEAIKSRIVSNITKMDTREGSFADDMAGPVAVELSNMYAALNAVRYMVWVDETSGPYLDLAAEDLGMEPRKAGTRAEVVLLIKGRAGYVIPARASFFTEDGLYYNLQEDAAIPEGGVLLAAAEAREVGARYNTAADTVCCVANCDIRLESVTNPDSAEGGSDPESDASLYARIVAYRQRPATSGNEAHYEQWAMEVPGVGISRCQGLWNGPGTVKVLIADESSQPVDDAIVQACAQHIETKRPIGPEVTVRSAIPFPVRIQARVRLKAGAQPEQVEQEFRAGLASYFQSISLVRSRVLYNRIGALLIACEGVVDYMDLTLNERRENLEMSAEQVPVAGEVLLT